MKAPRLLKRESISSFRARVAAWEKRTGKKYPQTGWGTREERALSNRAMIGISGPTIDYSKDYNLDDEAKEFSLDPSNNSKKWRESKEGKEFSNQQLMIQQNIDDAAKEKAYADAIKGNNNIEESIEKNVDSLTAQVKGGLPSESNMEKGTTYEHPLSDPDYNPESTKRNKLTSKWTGEVGSRKLTKPTAIQKKLREAGFTDENLVKLMIKNRDWKAARR